MPGPLPFIITAGVGLAVCLFLLFNPFEGHRPQRITYNTCRNKSNGEHTFRATPKRRSNSRSKRKEEDCAICLEPLSKFVTYSTPCEHNFHLKCFAVLEDKADNNVVKCPLCRAKVDPGSEI